jgi:hypothetical protein
MLLDYFLSRWPGLLALWLKQWQRLETSDSTTGYTTFCAPACTDNQDSAFCAIEQ